MSATNLNTVGLNAQTLYIYIFGNFLIWSVNLACLFCNTENVFIYTTDSFTLDLYECSANIVWSKSRSDLSKNDEYNTVCSTITQW
jgi:hypothetical protein